MGRQFYDQNGFASLIIAVILLLVISLITVGFALQMRNEQRAALDNQLSTQAYYASESGINDAVKALNDGLIVPKTSCGPETSANGLAATPAQSTIVLGDLASKNVQTPSAGYNVNYTCLLIDPAPYSLDYGSVSTTHSQTVLMTGINRSDPTETTPQDIGSLRVSWQSDQPYSTTLPDFATSPCGNNACFPPASSWTSQTGMLEVSVTHLPDSSPPATFNEQYLDNGSFTTFLYPFTSSSCASSPGVVCAGSVVYTPANDGEIVGGNCNSSLNDPKHLYCNVDITGISFSTLLVRIRPIYSNAQVQMLASSAAISPSFSTSDQIRIKGAQSLVDSTGEAQDVLRRVQVRVPSRNDYDYPESALEATNTICKQVDTYPGYYVNTCEP